MSRPPPPAVDLDVRRARTGDRRAFERLYRRHLARTHLLARRMLGSAEAADDATQEIFLRAWQRLPSFRGQASFGTWLHHLARNVLLNRLARGRAAKRSADFADREIETAAAPPPNVHPATAIDLETAIETLAAPRPHGAGPLPPRGLHPPGDRRAARHRRRHLESPPPPGPRAAARGLERQPRKDPMSHPRSERPSAYLDDDLPAGGHAAIEAHLASCAACRAMPVRASGPLTAVEIVGMRRGVDVMVAQGDIVLRGVAGPTAITAHRGTLRLDGVSGRTTVTAAESEVTVRASAGDPSVETTTGAIHLLDLAAERASATSVGGRITWRGPVPPLGRVTLATHGGGIDVQLPAEADLELDLRTLRGRLETALPWTLPSGDGGSRRLRQTLGDGGGQLTIDTFSGVVRIEQPAPPGVR